MRGERGGLATVEGGRGVLLFLLGEGGWQDVVLGAWRSREDDGERGSGGAGGGLIERCGLLSVQGKRGVLPLPLGKCPVLPGVLFVEVEGVDEQDGRGTLGGRIGEALRERVGVQHGVAMEEDDRVCKGN
jgi:hypothetical protein